MMKIEVRPRDVCGEQSGTATGVSPHNSTFSCQYSLQCSVLNLILTIPLSKGQAGEAWELSRTRMFCRISASTERNKTGHCLSVFIELAIPLGADDILSVFGTIVLWFYSSVFLCHLEHPLPLPPSPTQYTLHQKPSFRCTKDFLVNCNRLVSRFHNTCHMDTE